MAGDWIKMRVNLDTDPAVFDIAAELGQDELSVVGRLWKLWSWADQHCLDGNAVGVTGVTLDRMVGVTGFAAALRKVGWLEGQDGALLFPNFDRHNGQTAKKRGLTAARVAKHRNARSVTTALPEKSRVEKNKTPSPAAVDLPEKATVLAFAPTIGVPENVAEAWFEETNARPLAPDGSWTDRNGRPIRLWQSALRSWGVKWAANEHRPASAARPGAGGKESVWSLEKRVEEAVKEIDRLKSNPANKVFVEDSWDRRLKPEIQKRVDELKAKINGWRSQLRQEEAHV